MIQENVTSLTDTNKKGQSNLGLPLSDKPFPNENFKKQFIESRNSTQAPVFQGRVSLSPLAPDVRR